MCAGWRERKELNKQINCIKTVIKMTVGKGKGIDWSMFCGGEVSEDFVKIFISI